MPSSPNIEAVHLNANVSQPEVPLNTSLDLLDEAIAGILVHNMSSDADYTLSTATDPEEWQYSEVNITDTSVNLTTARNIIAPTNEKVYIFRNDTAEILTLKTSAGSGVAVAPGNVSIVRCDGTDIVTATGTTTESLLLVCSDETTALTTGTAKLTFRMPYAFSLSGVRASLTGAGSSSGTTTIDINEGGTSVLSTKLTIDFGAKTSTTAATPAVISDAALADDAEITIDIDAVTGGADETGLKVTLIGRQT